MMLVGYAKKYVDRPHRIHTYVNQGIYPFYILHQTIIVILAYYVVKVDESILAKYLFIVLVTFVLCVFIYHILIRPYNVTRVLFGMKPVKKEKPVTEPQENISENVMAPAI
jgi:peptidoglycan/LPS O-acetylase OafA/YrhL